jgi:hypothetical protein
MERESGEAVKDLNAILMKEITHLIRNTDMEYLTGLVEIFIRENIKKMREMGMER